MKKRTVRRLSLALLLVFLGLVCVLRLPAEVAGRLEPVSAMRPDYRAQLVIGAHDC